MMDYTTKRAIEAMRPLFKAEERSFDSHRFGISLPALNYGSYLMGRELRSELTSKSLAMIGGPDQPLLTAFALRWLTLEAVNLFSIVGGFLIGGSPYEGRGVVLLMTAPDQRQIGEALRVCQGAKLVPLRVATLVDMISDDPPSRIPVCHGVPFTAALHWSQLL